MSESWYSDAALAKQAAAEAKRAAGEPPSFADLLGIAEPRVPPSDSERCRCCGSDARPESFGGGDGTHCGLCIGRGHDEDEGQR